MYLLGLLASVGGAYNKAAAAILSRVSPGGKTKSTTLLHTAVGLGIGVGTTVLGGLIYYLFGGRDEACKGTSSVCFARRDWIIIPAFIFTQIAAIVLLALLQLIGDGSQNILNLKIPGTSESKKADAKRDILPMSWMVYGLCLGLSFLFGLLVFFDMYASRAWLGFFVAFLLLCGFAYIHASQLHLIKPAKPAQS